MSHWQLTLITRESILVSGSRFLAQGIDSEPVEVEFCERVEFTPLEVDFGLWGWSILSP